MYVCVCVCVCYTCKNYGVSPFKGDPQKFFYSAVNKILTDMSLNIRHS